MVYLLEKLIHFSGGLFYEWRQSGNQKTPYYISMVEKIPMSFAGIWEKWWSAEGALLETCAILTTAANKIVAPVHERMPVREKSRSLLD